MEDRLNGAIVPLGFKNITVKEDGILQWTFEPEVSKPGLLAHSKSLQWVFVNIVILSLIIGSCFKCILYSRLYEKHKLKEQTPIDVLILTSAIIQHSANVIYTMHVVLIVCNDATPPTVIGEWYCILFINAGRFEIIYMSVGSFGLSLFRILYIKQDYCVKYTVGEKRLMAIILYAGILLAILLTAFQRGHTYHQQMDEEHCTQLGEVFLKTLAAYDQSRGIQKLPFTSFYHEAIYIAVISMTLAEMFMYGMFFHHLYQHDNQERLKSLLGLNIIESRNRNNAISFLGQFFAFLFEIGFLIALMIGTKHMTNIRIIIPVMRVVGFALLSMVEVMTSMRLRSRLLKRVHTS